MDFIVNVINGNFVGIIGLVGVLIPAAANIMIGIQPVVLILEDEMC